MELIELYIEIYTCSYLVDLDSIHLPNVVPHNSKMYSQCCSHVHTTCVGKALNFLSAQQHTNTLNQSGTYGYAHVD